MTRIYAQRYFVKREDNRITLYDDHEGRAALDLLAYGRRRTWTISPAEDAPRVERWLHRLLGDTNHDVVAVEGALRDSRSPLHPVGIAERRYLVTWGGADS
jgi:hypothetical protein